MKKSRKKKHSAPVSISDHERKRVDEVMAAIALPKKRLAISETTKQIILNPDAALGDDGVLLKYVVNKQDEQNSKIKYKEELSKEEAEIIDRHQELYAKHIDRNRRHRRFKPKWERDQRFYDEFIVLRTYKAGGDVFGLSSRRKIRRWMWLLTANQRAFECHRARAVYNDLRVNRLARAKRKQGLKFAS